MSDTKVYATPGWGNVALMGTGHFISDFFCNVLPVMLPILAVRYGISYSQSAALFMVFSVSTNFLQPPLGLWADRKDIAFLMPLSLATGAVFACMVGLTSNLYVLILIILLAGVCASAFHPIAAQAVYAVSIKRRRALCTSLFIAGGNVGFATAPVIIATYVESFGDKLLPVLAIPALIVTYLTCHRHLHHLPRPQFARTGNVPLKSMLTRQFMLLNSAIALRSWTYCAFVVFLPLLLTAHGYSTVEAAFALLVLLVGTVAGGLIAGSLSDIFPLKLIIIATLVLTGAGSAFFLYDVEISFLSLTALFITGAGMYGSTPSAIVWAQRLLPHNAAFAASMMLGFTFGLGYIESVITGFVGDYVGLQLGLAVTVVPAAILGVIIMIFLKEPPALEKDLKESVKA